MKIAFIMEAIGMGHLMRTLTVKKEAEKRGHETFIISDGAVADKAQEMGHEVYRVPLSISLEQEGELDVDKATIEVIKKLNPMSINKMDNIFKSERPEVIFVDNNFLGLVAARFYKMNTDKKVRIFFMVNNNDFSVFGSGKRFFKTGSELYTKFIKSSVDRIFIPDVPPPYCITQKNLVFTEKMEFVGPVTRMRKISPEKVEKNRIFITLGGSSAGSNRFLDHLPEGSCFYSNTLSHQNIEHMEFDKGMTTSEIIVSHGGHTTIIESLLMGKPLILFPMKGYGERIVNCLKVRELGLGIVLDDEWIDDNIFLQAIYDARSRRKAVESFSKFLRFYKGEERILDVMEHGT
ncbi:hypothetical protein KAW38_01740 [Candidatus Micrarchaeota archaeon]|nr:hypothetical protein [Candidatus Micrarchaeota archaeon]